MSKTDLDAGNGIFREVTVFINHAGIFIVVVGVGKIGINRCPCGQTIHIAQGVFVGLAVAAGEFDLAAVIGGIESVDPDFVLQAG